MRTIFLPLAFMAFAGHARRAQERSQRMPRSNGKRSVDENTGLSNQRVGTARPSEAFARFLLSLDPAIAFHNLGPGALCHPTAPSLHGHTAGSAHRWTQCAGRATARRANVVAQNPPPQYDAPDNKVINTARQQFDLLSFRNFRTDTIIQYEQTNQSEPLRIALWIIGILFGLSVPTLANELGISDEFSGNVGSAVVTVFSAFFFVINVLARKARLVKIDKEYAMGDLSAKFRGVRTQLLRDLRQKNRVVAVYGPRAVVDAAVAEARVFRRRLAIANAIVIPVYTDETEDSKDMIGESDSRWLWSAEDMMAWKDYFDNLLSARKLFDGGKGAWVGLNVKGRTFGSALGMPRWDELLGTQLTPQDDGYGDIQLIVRDTDETAQEATQAAAFVPGKGASEAEHKVLLAAQARFYEVLTSGDVATMQVLWTDEETALDSTITDAQGNGAKIEPWSDGSPSFPPAGMRATDRDVLILPTGEGRTTAIERPEEGGTLLATQCWRKDSTGTWRIEGHRYIPWSAAGGTAVLTLRCDQRGCVLYGRKIDKPAA